MSEQRIGGLRLPGRSCTRRAGAILAAGAVLAAPTATFAEDAPTMNTFSGSCRGFEGHASWPEQPLRLSPADTLLSARFTAGQCSGTMNGERIQSAPASASADLRGMQSCAGGVLSGRGVFVISGRSLRARMTYRRAGPRVTIVLQGDGGGSGVILAVARVGLISDDHPLADNPVGALFAGPVTGDEVLRACANEGVRRLPIQVEQMLTTPSLSSPAQSRQRAFRR